MSSEKLSDLLKAVQIYVAKPESGPDLESVDPQLYSLE